MDLLDDIKAEAYIYLKCDRRRECQGAKKYI